MAALVVSAAPALGAFGYLDSLGTFGTGEGQFVDSRGVAVDGAGNLVVADGGNSRVQVVDTSGAFVRQWGSAGTADGQFDRLVDVAVGGSGNVYTAEQMFGGQGRNLIQKFNPSGTFLTKWGAGEFNWIAGLAVDASDNVYVADGGASQVKKFNSTGTTLLKQWGSSGAGVGQFRTLSGITVDAAGNVYTLEAAGGPSPSTQRVQKFDPDGNPLLSFSIGGDVNSEAFIPGIDVDAAGNIYVAGAGSMLRFTPTGGQAERITDCQTNMLGVAAHPNGKVYAGVSTGLFVFGEGGTSCQESAPARLVFEGDEGVTVNDGARFTNDPLVELTIEPALNTTNVRISNDGGFAAATTMPVSESRLYAWTLDDSGPERLPKTVYVRFANEVESSAQNFTDDIILDQSDPQIGSATLSEPGGSTASASAAGARVAHSARKRRFRLTVKARDKVSRVRKMQVAATNKQKRKPGKKARNYRKRVTIKAKRTPRFVRVRDGAGNWSRWNRIKRR